MSDCPDRSDEWDCLARDNNTLAVSLLSPGLGWREVCSDGWTEAWSSQLCSSLGYSDQPEQTKTVLSPLSNQSWWNINRTSSPAPRPLLTFQDLETETCQSQSAVSVQCQNFGEQEYCTVLYSVLYFTVRTVLYLTSLYPRLWYLASHLQALA